MSDSTKSMLSGIYEMGKSVREYIDQNGGGAGGGGGGSSSTISAVNQIQENIDNIPLIGSGVQIPDAILIKDINATTTNGNDNLIMLPFAAWSRSYDSNGNQTSSVQHFSYETNNGVGTRWYIRFDVEDGTYTSHSADQHVKKEFNSIQEYISNDRALYFGGGGSSGGESSLSSLAQSTYTGDGSSTGIYIPLDFTPSRVDIQSAGSTLSSGPYYGNTTLLFSNSGQESIYNYGISNAGRQIGDIGTISGQGFIAKGHVNDSAFNVNGCTYHYTAYR